MLTHTETDTQLHFDSTATDFWRLSLLFFYLSHTQNTNVYISMALYKKIINYSIYTTTHKSNFKYFLINF